MLLLYKLITSLSAPLLSFLLNRRVLRGKEDAGRLNERRGKTLIPRPDAQLIWIHAASVGEAQSALILIDLISKINTNAYFLLTSGTVTSANLMARRLPENAIHQFYPLDHPKWVTRFLNHWRPDLALWMESELWPNMLQAIRQRKIPAVLVNARLSERSYKRWRILKNTIEKLLSTFTLILAQTDLDAARYRALCKTNVIVTDNLKHSATPLPYQDADLTDLQTAVQGRPLWLYASTHDGEEALACRIHTALQENHPDLLTIIVPRHPERREEIEQNCKMLGLNIILRGNNKNLPAPETQIYIADTLGELGLFYYLSPIAMIGRSFSNDGGGGHNPIEAAQLDCAILTGPKVQYQTQLFNEMFAVNAARQVQTEDQLLKALETLLGNVEKSQKYITAAQKYAASKDNIIGNVMSTLEPLLKNHKKKKAA